MARISIDGLAGTGKSSTAKALAKRLGYESFSNGDFARMQAKELGLSIQEFDELAKTDDKYDRMRDKMVEDYGLSHDNFIAEGRLGWRFMKNAHKVKLHCDFDERVRRAAKRDNVDFETAKSNTIQREKAIADRFSRYYGIEDANKDPNFDLVIDTTNTPLPKVVEKIYQRFDLK